MARLTLRLPDSLLRQLTRQADEEGVSLNHYIVYRLARSVPAADLESRRSTWQELLTRYPEDEAEEALAEVLAERS